MASLRFEFCRTAALSEPEVGALWDLYRQFFEAERPAFERAVRRADEVVRFVDPTGKVRGMGLISSYWEQVDDRRIRVFWTGAVCVEREFRGQSVIQRSGMWRLMLERLRHPLAEVFWFFDTFSVASYLLMPRNMRDYWPRSDRPTPAFEAGLIDKLARRHDPEAWHPERGVVGAVGRRLREVPAHLDALHPDPHVRFFLAKNPGYREGERLACLAPLHTLNVLRILGGVPLRALRRRGRASRPRASAAPAEGEWDSKWRRRRG